MNDIKAKYKVDNTFLHKERNKFLVVLDKKFIAKSNEWLYNCFYPQDNRHVRYYEHRLNNECVKMQADSIARILYRSDYNE